MRFSLVLTLLLVACSANAPAPNAGGGPSRVEGGSQLSRTLVLAMATEPGTLDPSQGAGSGNSDYATLTNAALAT
jgi:hypothetical protein